MVVSEFLEDENEGGVGKGISFSMPGDTIIRRHIATRASNKRSIIVRAEGGVRYEGYSIGLDDNSLQILDLSSGDVHTVSVDYIVSVSDGKPFDKLTTPEKNTVDRRTASFRKRSQLWLEENWPEVYNRTETYRREDADTWRTDKSSAFRSPPRPGPLPTRYRGEE